MQIFIDGKSLFVGRMSSGRLYIELTSAVGWEGFPGYAEEFVSIFSGRVVSRNDSVDTRVWGVSLNNEELRLVYEDFPVMITLESISDGGDKVIEAIKAGLNVGS